MTTVSAITRFGLAGCLLSAGLLVAASPCSAKEVAPTHTSAAVSQGQGTAKHDSVIAPVSNMSVPETAHPITVIGLGWG